MEEKSLRITGTNTTIFNRITNKITKMLIPTKIGINGMLISIKRNNLIKTYEAYKKDDSLEEYEKKYENAYTIYLETLDKYVMDSIYKKVKNNTASQFEKDALAKYYEITSLKDKEYIDYKYRKQKYLLELDKEGLEVSSKEKIIEKYNKFYVEKMDELYKSILKNYSIKLADTTNIYDSSKEWLYIKIFYTLEEYIENILHLKIKIGNQKDYDDVTEELEEYEAYSVGKLDTKDNIEKNILLLGISRKIFTHSIPLIVAEQCYEKLLKDARVFLQDTKMAVKRESAFETLIKLIEEYNVKILSTKVYWENLKERDIYKKFWDKYKENAKLKDIDFEEYKKQKEILFIKDDMKKIRNAKVDYSRLIKYYKRKLLDYGEIRAIKNEVKSYGKYKGYIRNTDNRVSA